MLKKCKFLVYLLSAFALLSLSAAFSFYFCNENVRFERFCNKFFLREITSDTLSLHYTLAYPEAYGITGAKASLPFYTRDASRSTCSLLDDYILSLRQIPSSQLESDNQYTYHLLLSYLESIRRLEQYSYFSSPFSPVSGVHSQFPILLSEYAFRTKKDVENYLQILTDSRPYFESLLTYQKEKTEAGLKSDDLSLAKSADQCLTVLSTEELKNGTHFLQTSFCQKITALYQQGVLSKEDAEEYILENNVLLTQNLLPTYQMLSAELLALRKEDSSTPQGLCQYPKGKEYYQSLVQFQTGSDRSINEIENTLENLLSSYRLSLGKLLSSSSESIQLLNKARDTNWFSKDAVSGILTHLAATMHGDYPAFPAAQSPKLTIRDVSASLSETSAPAFYLTPPIDDFSSNVIYLNTQTQEGPLTLYTTLAHEGYPGHLYQTVYYQQFAKQNDTLPIRHILSYDGYQEGWALYVEFESYDYLIALANEMGASDLTLGYEIEKHNRMMQLCLYSLLDIYIHYEGYSQSQITAYLASLGISDTATCETIYQYIANAPANYLKYFWSYLEILTLKKNAMYLLKDNYSDLWFHQFFLDCGPSDFTSLAKALALKNSLKLPSAF